MNESNRNYINPQEVFENNKMNNSDKNITFDSLKVNTAHTDDHSSFKNVMVLAKRFKPTQTQLELLKRGLTFIPSIDIHKDQKKQMKLDIQAYHRRIKLASYFEGKKDEKRILPFILKSNWTPPLSSLPPCITKIIKADLYAFNHFNWDIKNEPNLSKAEVEALKQLQINKDIVIKPADKGALVVILDREQYRWEALRQLNNSKHYAKLDGPIYPDTIPMVNAIMDQMEEEGFINHKQRCYLQGCNEPRARRFYLLLKVHKEPDTWSKPFEIPPGRPIVSDCNSETYQTAEFIEYYLNPISTLHPSYIKDTFDFLQKIKDLTMPIGCILFTIDIDSLYTNIETKSGLMSVNKWFKKYPDPRRPDAHLLKLLEINLVRNDFEFEDEFYLQISGTAMGKKFAPSYANIFMADWEESALNLAPIKPLYYFRFLDDIWGIWTHSMVEFKQFINLLNHHHPSITVKYTVDDNSVNFLDVTTYKGTDFAVTGKLDCKVFFKETDTHALLWKNSFHPKHTYRGLVYSQLLRFHRICTQNQDFVNATRILYRALKQRGYTYTFRSKVLRGLFDPKPNKEDNKPHLIPLISTYSQQSLSLTHILRRNYNMFLNNTFTLQKHKIIAAYRRNKNLQDLLVHSKLKPLQSVKKKTCKEYKHLRFLTNSQTKIIYKSGPPIQYDTVNCVYLLYCSKCHLKYIGETKNSIQQRLYQHKYNIRNWKRINLFVVKHFISHGLDSLMVMGLESDPHWTDPDRKRKETEWILKLGTKHPWGLNEI